MVEKSLAADLWLACDNCCLPSLYKRFIGRKCPHAALCLNIFLKIYIMSKNVKQIFGWDLEEDEIDLKAIASLWNSYFDKEHHG